MAAIVTIVGAFSVLIGLLGLFNPSNIAGIAEFWRGATRFWIAVDARFVMGVVFLAVAPACRLPLVVQVVGVIAIIAAIVILIVGQKRLDSFIAWWLARLPAVRASALFSLLFGVLLVYAGF